MPQSLFTPLQDGQPVDAATFNRIFAELANRIGLLDERVSTAVEERNLLLTDAAVAAETVVGTPVYLDEATGVFRPAKAIVVHENGEFRCGPEALVAGIVAVKRSSQVATLLLAGLYDIDISAATSDSTPGVYYLAGGTAGRLTKTPSTPRIPVLHRTGATAIRFVPTFSELVEKHAHYSFPLTVAAAGVRARSGSPARDSIGSPNPALPGWLPASHASFAGKAPTGAAYGYNLAAHPALKAVWPPSPLSSVIVERSRGAADGTTAEGDFFRSLPIGVDRLVAVDDNGIWWMSDLAGETPWPFSDAAEPDGPQGSTPEAPRRTVTEMRIVFSRPTPGSRVSGVRSLRPKAGGAVSLRCVADGSPATAGDLEIDVDLNLTVGAIIDNESALALKSIEDGTLTSGPVVTTIRGVGDNVRLSGGQFAPVDPENPSGPKKYWGPIELSVTPVGVVELSPVTLRLDRVEQQQIGDIAFFSFAPNETSELFAVFRVPIGLGYANPRMKLQLRCLYTASGTAVDLVGSYKRIPAAASPTALPSSSTSLSLPTGAVVATANAYRDSTSPAFAVASGDYVSVRVTRNADGYVGSVGLISLVAHVEETP